MNRRSCLIVLVFYLMQSAAAGDCYAGSKKICGRVTDATNVGIPFCLVKAQNALTFVYCNDSGDYCITVGDTVGTLLFYCAGYDRREIAISGGSLPVVLYPLKRSLDEVLVTATGKRKLRTGMLGERSKKPIDMTGAMCGGEKAVYLAADVAEHGILKEVCFYIVERGDADSRLRVHVYEADKDSLPGNELTDSNVVVYGRNVDKGWLCLDLSSLHIHAGSGVFLSIEWLEGYERTSTDQEMRRWPQAIGIAKMEGRKQGWWYVKERRIDNKWRGGSSATAQPMMYATYTYWK